MTKVKRFNMAAFDFSKSPVEFEELSDSKVGRAWEAHCHKLSYDEPWVRMGKIKAVFARSYVRYYERIRDFQVQNDDVWVSSFPKCGTTWTQEMVYCISTNLDFEAAKTPIQERFPYFELYANWSPNLANLYAKMDFEDAQKVNPSITDMAPFKLSSFDRVEKLSAPRFIKTHLHYSLLPTAMKTETSPKMIYVARNPKDTCMSWFHHQRLMDGWSGSLEEFVECFVSDSVFASPYWTHLQEYWELRDRSNILFIKYEDMKKNLPTIIRKVAAFLDKTLTDEQVERLREHLSFESMQKNPAVNYENMVADLRNLYGVQNDSKFMRKGQVGSYKDEMTPDMVAKLDAWTAKNKIIGLYEN